jgi:hypothetical protein
MESALQPEWHTAFLPVESDCACIDIMGVQLTCFNHFSGRKDYEVLSKADPAFMFDLGLSGSPENYYLGYHAGDKR